MNEIRESLLMQKDEKYADFTSSLLPYTPRERIIGVRSPILRKIAKELISSGMSGDFVSNLPHMYHDENLLHAMLISSEKKDIEKAICEVEAFLPYVENWAVCDILVPKVFLNHPEKVYKKLKEWLQSAHTYTVRFAFVVLLTCFLDDSFDEQILKIASEVRSEEYYVNMAKAWFFSFAIIKRPKETLPYFEDVRLDKWVHNKSIQKAIESYRVSAEQKEYLRSLKL